MSYAVKYKIAQENKNSINTTGEKPYVYCDYPFAYEVIQIIYP